MHPASNSIQANVVHGLPRVGASLALLALGCWGIAVLARTMPDIIRQLTQPCGDCYLGAFAPPLEPYVHPPRRQGAAAVEGNTPPADGAAPGSLPDRAVSQPGSWRWLEPSSAIAEDQTSLFGTGAMRQTAGTSLAAGTFLTSEGGMARAPRAGVADPSLTWAPIRFEPRSVDAAVNGDATERDAWLATPAWNFREFGFAGRPASRDAPAIDGGWAAPAAAASAYRPSIAAGDGETWNDQRRMEFTLYPTPDPDLLNVGPLPAAGEVSTPWGMPMGGMPMGGMPMGGMPAGGMPVGTTEATPWWRVALGKNLERHFVQIGTYGTSASMVPEGNQSAGTTDTISDMGADANYQFLLNPGGAISNRLSATASLIHESRSLSVANRILGANGFDTLDMFHVDAAWSIADTVTPSIRYFRTVGSTDTIQSSWSGWRPNSAGVIAEVAYVPWGTAGSPIGFLNLRLAAQYVAYTEFNGIARGASGNNAVSVSLSGALHF